MNDVPANQGSGHRAYSIGVCENSRPVVVGHRAIADGIIVGGAAAVRPNKHPLPIRIVRYAIRNEHAAGILDVDVCPVCSLNINAIDCYVIPCSRYSTCALACLDGVPSTGSIISSQPSIDSAGPCVQKPLPHG